MEHLPPDGLFRPGWERAFDGGAWERDGVLVLPDVLTDAARGLWLASLQRLQRISDTIVRETPWADAAAWAPLGLVPTRPPLSDAEKARLCGGCSHLGGWAIQSDSDAAFLVDFDSDSPYNIYQAASE